MTLTSEPSVIRRPGRIQTELLAAGAWSARHGIARVAMGRARRRGDLQAIVFSDPAAREDPYPLYRRIRERGPVVRGEFMACTASHAIADGALRSDAFGVAADASALPPLARWLLSRPGRTVGPVTPPSLLAVNAPDHTRYRRLVAKVFTARAMEALRGRVASLADELLDRAARRGEIDLVSDYATLLPVTVIAEILGVPADMRAQFVAWGAQAAPVLDIGLSYPEFRRVDRAIRQLNGWMSGHFERLRRDPGDDLLSRLVAQDLDENELLAIAGLLLAAGFETTVNLIGNGVSLQLAHPAELEVLRADGGWANAVDEILRYESPVQNTARRALRDTSVEGVPVRAGTFLAILLGGANRDPEVFDDPERFDVRRHNAREHLAFSSGVHYCLGASLARIEGEEALRRLFERYPDLAAAGRPRRRPTRTLRGFDRFPVRLGRP
ncbi:cytochrome P450 [Cryptosporangium sp. NPDC051539]|uniref:cytochrome P450 n=1 Tax=Cryptosporangium sp. NPDC051539 TaxID=3363962 RepID=UPI0037B169E1